MEIIFRLVNMQLLIQDKKSSREGIARNDGTFHTSLQSGTKWSLVLFKPRKAAWNKSKNRMQEAEWFSLSNQDIEGASRVSHSGSHHEPEGILLLYIEILH